MNLKEINQTPDDPSKYDDLEIAIARAFREEIYLPMIRELDQSKSVLNENESLRTAIQQGRIYFSRGSFKGRFNAQTTKELKKLGAKWNRFEQCFKLAKSQLPSDIRLSIGLSESMVQSRLKNLQKFLDSVDPAKIAEKVKAEKLFDALLSKTENKFKASIDGITIAPRLTPERLERISKEYTNNLELSIVDWTTAETKKLRVRMEQRVFDGQRFEGMIDEIQRSYGVSQSKAKFLASQESRLLMVKYTQSRYQDSGVNEYRWRCAAGSPNHPVRPMHKIHDGKIFTWDNPPIVDDHGDRKNPGQDYNCRCLAIPLVRF
jgi:SPP1 gp7 family putative phage head morphogenesis protein